MMKTAPGAITEGPEPRTGRGWLPAKLASSVGLGLILLFQPALGLGAEVKPAIKYVYYDVPYTRGLSVSEMIDRHSPLSNKKGRRQAGITDYQIGYEINKFSPVEGICSVLDPKVSCQCKITLPRLRGGQGDADLQKEFASELADIQRHELVHCDIAARYAGMLLKSYMYFKDRLCGDLDGAVSREFERIIAECWAAQISFDHSEYGYQDHLDVGDFRREVGENYRISPQTSDGSRPALALELTEPSKDLPQAPPPLKDVSRPAIALEPPEPPDYFQPAPSPPATGKINNNGIYKDQDGVWRNY